jgi:hypothetical protein
MMADKFDEQKILLKIARDNADYLAKESTTFRLRLAEVRHQLAQAQAEIERLRQGYTASGFESWLCPGCEYSDGVFIKACGLHAQIERLAANREGASDSPDPLEADLERAAQQSLDEIRAEGLEEAAKLAETFPEWCRPIGMYVNMSMAEDFGNELAAAIRARKRKP